MLVEKRIDNCLDVVYAKRKGSLGRFATIGGGEADVGSIDDYVVVKGIDCFFELLKGLRTVL